MINPITNPSHHDHYGKTPVPAGTSSTAFKDALKKASDTQGSSKLTETKEMTLEEYKQILRQKISELPIHPSQSRTQIAVNISDKAFEKMMQDPDYEKSMLALLEREFGYAFPPNMAPSYSVYNIGETLEDYNGMSMGSSYGSTYAKESENSFWEKRMERRKKQKKLDKKRLEQMQVLEAAAIRIQNMKQPMVENGVATAKKSPIIKTISAAELLSCL